MIAIGSKSQYIRVDKMDHKEQLNNITIMHVIIYSITHLLY
jgi:hypothetical protein